MKILIDIGHPAHVHLFKNFAKEMLIKGHQILFTCREKEFETNLLKSENFDFISFGRKYRSIKGKAFGLVKFNYRLFKVALKFKPDIFLSAGSMYAAQVSFIYRKPHICFEDTFNFEQVRLYKSFTKTILTSNYKHPYLGKNNIKYKGYHELAYLHPKRFKPNNKILKELKLSENENYVLIRFVAWSASHDINHDGIDYKNKIKAIKEFSKYAKVFVSSEKELTDELKQYKLPTSPKDIHSVMFYACLIFGESATMVTEGAVLGVPGVYLDDTGRCYTKELEEKYGLVYNFSESKSDQEKAISKGIDILKKLDNKKTWVNKKNKILNDKIDVTAFLIWFIENYPKSINVMSENPEFQNKFK